MPDLPYESPRRGLVARPGAALFACWEGTISPAKCLYMKRVISSTA